MIWFKNNFCEHNDTKRLLMFGLIRFDYLIYNGIIVTP
ncbi:MAG: hypothetical protein HPY66_0699 [Firmicutes bacterium]|nr:hypothetical protein [Bacillota bacterium]